MAKQKWILGVSVAVLLVVIAPLASLLAWYWWAGLAHDSVFVGPAAFLSTSDGPISFRAFGVTVFGITNLAAIVVSFVSSDLLNRKGYQTELLWFYIAFGFCVAVLAAASSEAQQILGCSAGGSVAASGVDQVFGTGNQASQHMCMHARLSLWPPIGVAANLMLGAALNLGES